MLYPLIKSQGYEAYKRNMTIDPENFVIFYPEDQDNFMPSVQVTLPDLGPYRYHPVIGFIGNKMLVGIRVDSGSPNYTLKYFTYTYDQETLTIVEENEYFELLASLDSYADFDAVSSSDNQTTACWIEVKDCDNPNSGYVLAPYQNRVTLQWATYQTGMRIRHFFSYHYNNASIRQVETNQTRITNLTKRVNILESKGRSAYVSR